MPTPATTVYVGLGGGSSRWAFVDQITGTGMQPNAPDTPQADPTMSKLIRQRAATTTPGSPGQATYDFNPLDALAGFEFLRSKQGTSDRFFVREEQGATVTPGPANLQAAVAVDTEAASKVGTVTFSGSGAPADIRDDSRFAIGGVFVVGGNAYHIEYPNAAKTAVCSLLGAEAAGVVTPAPAGTLIDGAVSAAAATLYGDYGVRRQYEATLVTLSVSGTATDRTAQLVVQMRTFANKSFLLTSAAETTPSAT